MSPVISVENLSKVYRLGQIGTGTFTNDLKVWWARTRGKPNPLLRIGQQDHGDRAGEDLWALRDVSFTVEQGEVLGIIGRNGAGKSTLLKIISRVTAPTSGRIRVKGRIASLLEVGTGFHPELTGRENVYLNGAILGMTRAEVDRKFDEIVAFAEVEKFIDTPVKRYSSGMYVRLAFAVAAHLEPEILVVDEVLAVGDAEFQKKALGKMGDVAQGGRTVLFVSHNMPSITMLCNRAILLSKGYIDAAGVPENVVSNYLKAYAKNSNGEFILQQSPRRGNGSIKIFSWKLIDEKLGEGKQIGCSHACEFQLMYLGYTSNEVINDVSVALVIKDSLDQPMLSGATYWNNQDFQKIPSKGTFICRFSSMPLFPDRYKVYIWVSVNGQEADVIENAGFFEVVPSDVFGTGKLPRSKHGKFIIKHSWLLKTKEEQEL